MNQSLPTEQCLQEFARILARDGVHSALRYFNGLGDFRFTAVYVRDEATMRNVCFVDRDDPSVTRSDDIPLASTYCQYAIASGQAFSTMDAREDMRLKNHSARDQIRSYCGVPLLDADGNAFGTLCNFDVVPYRHERLDPELMLQMLALLHPNQLFQEMTRGA